MKIFLADSYSHFKCILNYTNYNKSVLPIYLLQTFYDLKDVDHRQINRMLNTCDDFLLDSGAFTFMNSGKKVHWRSYIDAYIRFINKYDIKHFFELDLYTLPDVGIQKTINIRKYIENKTGKKTIPVFHACMGIKMWRELCQQYDYVAIGASGITDECKWTKNEKLLKQVVDIANSYGAKVHGLGYTRLPNITRTNIPFYSVDSSTWVGSRFNTRYDIIQGQIANSKAVQKGERLVDWKQLDMHNLKVWRKIQQIKSSK